jgi:hypothetical protein
MASPPHTENRETSERIFSAPTHSCKPPQAGLVCDWLHKTFSSNRHDINGVPLNLQIPAATILPFWAGDLFPFSYIEICLSAICVVRHAL